jgi:glyoxylase-like metal-dependent hydrolase (beta-lactamase superfamily II)
MSTGFVEIADRVWVSRRDAFDVNVSVVAGGRGLVVIDTFTSAAGARLVLDEVRRLGGPVLAAINTHVHFDHTFGNGVFAAAGAELIAHENAAAAMPAHAATIREQAGTEPDEPGYADMAATEPVVPGRTFSSVLPLDLGDRALEIVHPGRGHTDGDVIVLVPDADVVLVGDLVEESTQRHAVPGFGSDCHPLEWPLTLDLVIGLIGERTRVVPGHGAPVGRDFVDDQRSAIGVVAETIRDLAGRGVPVDQALDSADWPYPKEELATAVSRGYAQLPAAQRRLPLI